MTLSQTLQIIESSIAPAIFISGFGLLLLSMTNRLSRPIDRVRALVKDYRHAPKESRQKIKNQIDILYRRSQILQASIVLLCLSIFLVTSIIGFQFFALLQGMNLQVLIQKCFLGSLILMVLSLSLFMYDIQLGLKSLKIEIDSCQSN